MKRKKIVEREVSQYCHICKRATRRIRETSPPKALRCPDCLNTNTENMTIGEEVWLRTFQTGRIEGPTPDPYGEYLKVLRTSPEEAVRGWLNVTSA